LTKSLVLAATDCPSPGLRARKPTSPRKRGEVTGRGPEDKRVAKKPHILQYGVDDIPPWSVILLSALQQIAITVIFLFVPVVVLSAAKAPSGVSQSVLSISMIVLGLAAVLQALRRGPIGSGYLALSTFSNAYIEPSVQAAAIGGMPLVFGMIAFARAFEMAFSRTLSRLRPVFPPELVGAVVFLVAISVSKVAVSDLLQPDGAVPIGAAHWWVAAVTLGLMVALNIWTRGTLRLSCSLIGIIIGFALALAVGLVPADRIADLASQPLFMLPRFDHLGWSFDILLAGPFAIGAIANVIKAIGVVTLCQRINDAEWVRPDMGSVRGGVMAEGMSTALAGLVGSYGVGLMPSSAALSAATGVASRRVAQAAAVIFLLLGFVPLVSGVLVAMPHAVIGAVLLFTSCFVFLNGIEGMTSRMLDARKILVIGMAVHAGLAVEVFPSFFRSAPIWAQPIVGSALVAGTLVAIALNLLFRIGVRKVATFSVDPQHFSTSAVSDFMQDQGAAWAARRDVVNRATFGAVQLLELLGDTPGPIELEARFDEFNLDFRVRYTGAPLEFPERRPSAREIMASAEGERLLAGHLLRRSADRISSRALGERAEVHLHYDH